MKTIKQIADELGVNKQKVYRFIVKNHITASSEVKQSKLYDEAAERLIKSHFDRITTSCERSSEPHQKSGNEMLLEQLIKELEVKNEQLSEKDRQIREKDRQIAEMQAQLIRALGAGESGVVEESEVSILPDSSNSFMYCS